MEKHQILKLVLEDAGIVWPLGQVLCLEVEQPLDPGPIEFLLIPCDVCLREGLTPDPVGTEPVKALRRIMPLVHMTLKEWTDGKQPPRLWHVWLGRCPECKTIWWRIRDAT